MADEPPAGGPNPGGPRLPGFPGRNRVPSSRPVVGATALSAPAQPRPVARRLDTSVPAPEPPRAPPTRNPQPPAPRPARFPTVAGLGTRNDQPLAPPPTPGSASTSYAAAPAAEAAGQPRQSAYTAEPLPAASNPTAERSYHDARAPGGEDENQEAPLHEWTSRDLGPTPVRAGSRHSQLSLHASGHESPASTRSNLSTRAGPRRRTDALAPALPEGASWRDWGERLWSGGDHPDDALALAHKRPPGDENEELAAIGRASRTRTRTCRSSPTLTTTRL